MCLVLVEACDSSFSERFINGGGVAGEEREGLR